MLTPTLKRVKEISFSNEVLEAQAKALARAQELFVPIEYNHRTGQYQPLLKGEAPPAISLLGNLKKLGITPIDPARVRKYQDSKQKTWMEYSKGVTLCRRIFACALPAFFALVLGRAFFPTVVLATLEFGLLTVAVLLLAGVTLVGGWSREFGKRYKCSNTWASSTIQEYGLDRLPPFAIDTAVKIKEAVPDVKMIVEYLVEKREEMPKPVWTTEPFLVAQRGAEIYYLEVWDERDFERHI